MYREFASKGLTPWTAGSEDDISITGIAAYFNIGGSIDVSFDFKNFLSEIKRMTQ